MNTILHLPPGLEAKLLERAAVQGKPPEALALEALRDGLTSPDDSPVMLPRGIWKQEFAAMISSMPEANVDADLSRDAIYEGRGE